MSECMPCGLETAAEETIIYRDEDWSCEMVEGYDAPGWFILRLRRHAEGWHEPTAEELAGFGPVSQRIVAAIREATGATGAYFMSFGENYPHFHFLVIGRPADLPADRRGAAILAAREELRDREAALATAEAVRRALAEVPAA